MNFKEEDINRLSNTELQELMKIIQDERTRRDNEARDKLINNFRKAFYDLQDAHILVKFYDVDWEDPVYLENWNGFEFC